MTEADDNWTIGRLLKWTEEYLLKVGSDSARLDAEVLLAHAKNCQRIELYAAFDEVASESLREQFRGLVKQRAAGTPVAYLVKTKEFYSLPFTVTPDVLIPRPETEFLVLRLLDLAKAISKEKKASPGNPITVVDVGTGSGIIAICAALYLPAAKVIAVDVSEAALEIAKANAERHKVSERIEFRKTSLLEGFSDRADIVASNLPYVSESEYAELDPTVRDHEPRLALVGGNDGTELIQELARQAVDVLGPQGWMILEISPMILERVTEVLGAGSFGNLRVTKDLAKLPRIVEAQLCR